MAHSTSDGTGQGPSEKSPQDLLRNVEQTYQKWFGESYDLTLIHAACATHAAYYMKGDPLWTMLVGAPGSCKTETINGLEKAGSLVISTITSEGALLSATKSTGKDKAGSAATGGLLMRMARLNKHFLIIKDVTTILSMNAYTRQQVLAALREVYDGKWSRNVGNEGGRTLEWSGRVGVLGAVTEAWDRHHAVISQMGDRFVIFRVDSCVNREQASLQAMKNTGHETRMREELGEAIEALLEESAKPRMIELTDEEQLVLLQAANLTTTARTSAERDYKGEVDSVTSPEMPTRFAKQLVMLMRGGIAIGLDREQALALALRGAKDSIPPARQRVLDLLTQYEELTVAQMSEIADQPYMSMKREAEALWMLKMLSRRKENTKRQKFYRLRDEWAKTGVCYPFSLP